MGAGTTEPRGSGMGMPSGGRRVPDTGGGDPRSNFGMTSGPMAPAGENMQQPIAEGDPSRNFGFDRPMSPASGPGLGSANLMMAPANGPSYMSPSRGAFSNALMLGPSRQGPIDVKSFGSVDPSLRAPITPARTDPDPVMDPAWYSAVQKQKGINPSTLSSFFPYYRKGGVVGQPSEGQKKAGNYKKLHRNVQGLDISIENPKGSTRTGKDGSKKWSVVMPADYGYIKRTVGNDGDHVDVFVGPNPHSSTVFVINQRHPGTGDFDEHKAMIGYTSEREACADYCKAFSDGSGPHRIKSIETISMDAFKKWLKSGKTKREAKGRSMIDHAVHHVMSRA